MIRGYRIRIEGQAGGIPLENRADLLDEAKLVLLLGCPRSGTTFLLRCLSALPRTRARSGILVPDRLCHVVGSAPASDSRVEDLLWSFRDSLWKEFLSGVASRRAHLREAVRHPRGVTEAIATLGGVRAIDPGRFTLVYKEPFMAFAADRLAAHFRGARIVHLIRDGRDCADSLDRAYGAALSDDVLRADGNGWRLMGSEIGVARPAGDRVVPWWVPEGSEAQFLSSSRVGRYLWLWAEAVERGRRARSAAPGRYFEVRYEDLCREPAATGRALRTFLDAPASGTFDRALAGASTGSVGIGAARADLASAPEAARALLHELGYARDAERR